MFIHSASNENAMFNNRLFNCATMPAMRKTHDTALRLYEAAKALHDVEGLANVARLLNESPQRLNNWERRGVSAPGAIKVAGLLGCSVEWILGRSDQMTIPGAESSVAPGQRPNVSASTARIGEASAKSSETLGIGNPDYSDLNGGLKLDTEQLDRFVADLREAFSTGRLTQERFSLLQGMLRDWRHSHGGNWEREEHAVGGSPHGRGKRRNTGTK